VVWLLLLPALYFIQIVHLAIVLKWTDDRTVGLNYYGLPPSGRDHFKKRLRLQAKILFPVLWWHQHTRTLDFRKARIVYKGISAPAGSCSVESFAAAEAYQPRPEDIFVVTQMRSGTTWMQHLVFQILHRGNGDLVETGRTLYAVSPWLEGRKGVPMDQAPLLGAECPSRIIKTHLPVELCPYNPRARYIYVSRDPVACFASCIDFLVTNLGAIAPDMVKFEEWFTSENLMWWGTWRSHVQGWRARAESQPNVLFVHFEEMREDLVGIARRVASFLAVKPLTLSELANVIERCSFAYMQKHQGNFEMHPPHLGQTDAAFFVSGKAERLKKVPADVRDRIARSTLSATSAPSLL
jgi:hypothetical protein